MEPRTATASDFVQALYALLPRGKVLTAMGPERVRALVEGLAVELSRVHGFLSGLIDEIDPQTTSDLLSEWERVCGLPRCGGTLAATDEARRAAIVAQLAATGGQSADYFESLAAAAGDDSATITEPLDTWPHVWQVASDEVTRFRADSPCDASLLDFTQLGAYVRCLLERNRPAHTRIWWTI